ncbi:M56 family metallopeptidase [Flagellimonas algicola]|uniref:Peptidase M56 domain-containing protein n=1 Tax=Flagellimonas algicola TaxID=2583815 RepID=A0ABY2WI42_9FLAO|nr:M56 family metallopeptidase [Allomuricauda algicola]TMU54508.1 hypothetical protein FGG15_09820 [Allomuricauda algicola]
MLIYILKSSACLVVLFLFYKLFLEKESIHTFKRFYLLGALVLSLIIPLLVFVEYIDAPITQEMDTLPLFNTGEVLETPNTLSPTFDLIAIAWSIYGLGLLLFGLKFIQNFVQITNRIRKNQKRKFPHCTHVLLQEQMPPHTFFRFIFLNKYKLENNEIPHEVLVHEETHVTQKHSWDIIFIELLQVALWFNPLILLCKKAIKLNHEFLADQAVLSQNEDITGYQNILLAFSTPHKSKQNQPALSNAIHYSSIKKRLTVMKSITSKKSMIIRNLLLLPIAALLLISFSTRKTIVKTQHEQVIQSKTAPIKIRVNEKQEILIEGKLVSLEKLSTEINRLANANDSSNQLNPQVELEVEGNLGIALLTSIKKQLVKTDASLTLVTADSIKMTGENLEETFKGIQFTARDTLQITLDEGKTVLGTSTPPTDDVKEVQSIKSTHGVKAATPLSSAKQISKVPTPIKTSDTTEISGSAEWPRVPMIAYRIDNGPISRELKKLVDSYSKKRRSYYDGVIRFVEHKQGNKEQIMHEYNEIMGLYESYRKLAKEEGVFAWPEPSMAPMVWDRLPPHSQHLIDHVIGLAEKNAVYFYNDIEISTDKAIQLLRNNHELRIKSMLEKNNITEVKMYSLN